MMANYEKLRSVQQVADTCPAVTIGQLRWWIFNAEQNGFGVVLVRVGGRVYVDIDAFNMWLEQKRQAQIVAND